MNDIQFQKFMGELENKWEKEFKPLREKYGHGIERKVCDKRSSGDMRDRMSERRVDVNMKERKVYRGRESYVDWDDDRSFGERTRHGEQKGYSCDGAKMTIPSFHGRSDPKGYLEWDERMERVFENHHHSETMKVRRACSEFMGYATTWWSKVVSGRRRCGETPIATWEEMKREMRKRFAPNHYDVRSGRRDLNEKFFASTRRSRSEEELMLGPKMDSTQKVPNHEYQGTSKTSCTYDIVAPCCKDIGLKVIQCSSELVTIVDSQVEVELDVVVESDPLAHVEEVVVVECEDEEFGVVVESVELSAVEGESLDDEVVHHVHVEEDMHACNAMVNVCSTSKICSGVEKGQFIHIDQVIPKDDPDNTLELRLKKSDMAEEREIKKVRRP